jgi:hypothetical protein
MRPDVPRSRRLVELIIPIGVGLTVWAWYGLVSGRGRGAVRRALPSSVRHAVPHRTPCPLVVVRNPEVTR